MNRRRVIFLGPPGSGKGTQARKIAEKSSLLPISSGETLRREIREQSEVGRLAANFVESGLLVPDDIITGVMIAGIKKLPSGTGFILDGFPRTVPQADALQGGLAAMSMSIDAVVDFELDDAEIVKRIVNRRVCTKCEEPYNLESRPPKVAGVCDICGGALTQRVDDREDVIMTRLGAYRAQTAPLVAHFARQGLLCSVRANRPAHEVEADILAILESPTSK
ncbi:MAG: adenylate kinase [Phycisphaerales bacterium]|nr:adenylate kinase [Phycisphaerales bacterium]